MDTLTIRPETAADAASIRRVHEAAFPTPAEANLVDVLRAAGQLVVSIVADACGEIVGHVAFSPVRLDDGKDGPSACGLAPVAVLPAHQRRGVGSALIRAGIDACRQRGCGFIVVLGHTGYYPRFGFTRASLRSLQNEYGADDAFMVLELIPGSIPARGGLVRYADSFAMRENDGSTTTYSVLR